MSSLRLEVIAGRAIGMSIIVDDELLIGRQAEGAGRLAGDEELSRAHARITVEGSGQCAVEDLGSMNGTFVNGMRISSPKTLDEGDTVEVGGTTLAVRDLPSPASPQESHDEPDTKTRRVTAARSVTPQPAESDPATVPQAGAGGAGEAAAQGPAVADLPLAEAGEPPAPEAQAAGQPPAEAGETPVPEAQASGQPSAEAGEPPEPEAQVAGQPAVEAGEAESAGAPTVQPPDPQTAQLASPPALVLRLTLELGVTFDPATGSAEVVLNGAVPVDLVLADGAWQVKPPA